MELDPFKQFELWFQDAKEVGETLPESMTLVTAGRDRRPSGRVVLMKDISQGGFVFYTNYESRKAEELEENPEAGLVFHWPRLERQVRIEGRIRKTSRAESIAYFKTRPRESRLGAWASAQSTAIPDRATLEARFAEIVKKYQGRDDIPCPKNWGGYRLIPERFEFWQGRPHRLHDRRVYTRKGKRWLTALLSP